MLLILIFAFFFRYYLNVYFNVDDSFLGRR